MPAAGFRCDQSQTTRLAFFEWNLVAAGKSAVDDPRSMAASL